MTSNLSFGYGRKVKDLDLLANSDAPCIHLSACTYVYTYNFQKYSLWRTVFFGIATHRLLRTKYCSNRKNDRLYPLGWLSKCNCSRNGPIQYPLKSVRVFPLHSVGTGLGTNCSMTRKKGWGIASAHYPALPNCLILKNGCGELGLYPAVWRATHSRKC